MVQEVQVPAQPEIIYPDSDGKPMADNTKQYRLIVTIQGGIDALFKDDANVFTAGDLLWYPVEGNNTICTAPDVMVVFGRPKGDRGSYKQWVEENIPPQVVFEILSPGNTIKEMAKKQEFYNHYQVEEYYLYDPEKVDLCGWVRRENQLEVIEEIIGWVSPRLEVRFEISEGDLQIYRPDGERFASYVELMQKKEQEQQRANQAEALLEEERRRREVLEARLREMGVDPDQL
ncbi:Uma2 family endonuclease [Microcoleus sp. FACHB-672]|uniref:Uma2 family endonuclease n=1 Tax=Microcoleus sp. FACHB-672 TaxID=2692825 RepID=UPI001681FC23|nr:Uma2 family endonuclease [Microcoleus sp. FACHB-672]MBD2042601.1 Uma2 family endonuclease [Microcoleus sp. FACHB-672]